MLLADWTRVKRNMGLLGLRAAGSGSSESVCNTRAVARHEGAKGRSRTELTCLPSFADLTRLRLPSTTPASLPTKKLSSCLGQSVSSRRWQRTTPCCSDSRPSTLPGKRLSLTSRVSTRYCRSCRTLAHRHGPTPSSRVGTTSDGAGIKAPRWQGGEGWRPRPRGCGPSAWRRTWLDRTRTGGPRAPSRRPARSRPRSWR